ncbi:MAG: NfeD family protein [Pirellulaceae bacterium]|nr:NfeD family protein [Pirellulaceae bacterium]
MNDRLSLGKVACWSIAGAAWCLATISALETARFQAVVGANQASIELEPSRVRPTAFAVRQEPEAKELELAETKPPVVRANSTWEDLLAQGPFERPFLLQIKGLIDHTTLRYVQSALRQAQGIDADLIVVEIDSPGGGAVESMEIADMLAQIQWGQTVAWIPREATSGGAMIALGCQYIVMQPGATIGDIGVIQLDPTMAAFRYAPAKIRSILVAKVRALAERHGRSPELAEAMVDEYAVVYQQSDDPQQFKLVSIGAPDELGAAPAAGVAAQVEEELPGGWRLVPESRLGRFVTLPLSRAIALGFSQHHCENFAEFEGQLKLQGEWTVRQYGFTDRVVDFLNNFWITLLLLIVGIIALFMEIASPGISVGGLLALLCFSLFFWSHFMGGTAGWLEVILFVTGVACLAAELFLIPGIGVAGAMGLGLVLLSLVMATLDFVYPTNGAQWNQLGSSLLSIMLVVIVGGLGIGLIIQNMGSIPALNRLTLQPPTWDESPSGKAKDDGPSSRILVVTEGRAAGLKVGDEGVTESVLRPAGRAAIAGRSVDVIADGKFTDPGQPIKVIDVRGNRLIVVPMQADA